MNEDEAYAVVGVLTEAYRRDEWSKERIKLWVRMLIDLGYEDTSEAVIGWVKTERWPPSIAEIRELEREIRYAREYRARMEAEELRRQLEPPPPPQLPPAPREPMTTAQFHVWRAALGHPVQDCGCESCNQARTIVNCTPEAADA